MMKEVTYAQKGDYLIPDIQMETAEVQPLGKYGRMRLAFMKEHRKGVYTTILTNGELNSYLHEIDETARTQILESISRMAQSLGVTEQMKAENPLKWVQMMNSIKNLAEEEVLTSLIYA